MMKHRVLLRHHRSILHDVHVVITRCLCKNVVLVDVKTYNALITSLSTQSLSCEEKWFHILVCPTFLSANLVTVIQTY